MSGKLTIIKRMTKEQYKKQESERRAAETQTRVEAGKPIFERGMAMLASIKEEIREKINLLWSDEIKEEKRNEGFVVPKKVEAKPLGSQNTDFPPNYFDSFKNEN